MNVSGLKRFQKLFFRSMMTKKWWLLVILTSLLFMMGGCAAVMMTTAVYDLDELENMKFATSLYDHKNKLVTTLGDTHSEYVDLDDIKSDLLVKTYVAVEDERFYNHNGADLKGLGRALVVDLLTMQAAEGGSTITMQVARNVILNTQEKTFMRKLTEIAIAYNLERKYTKKEILESYLNYIYLGNDVRGIKMAAKIYFDKDITREKLEPHEIALLAGLPKAPEGYNPYKNEEKAKQRRNVVLAKMAEFGYITEAEKEKYQKKDLGVDKKYLAKHLKDDKYQAYKDYLFEEAKERYGLDAEELVNGGYKIYTGLNRKAQLSLERTLKEDSYYQHHKNLDGGATIIDPKTGQIAAIGGGRHYLRGYKNHALSKVQPGSSIKPLTVYAPAVEERGYAPTSLVPDQPYSFRGWTPKNYDGRYHGNVPLQTVAAKSLNASTAWLLNEVVGVSTAYKYGQRAGLDLEPSDRQPAPLALGGLTRGVNTLQMAQAYSGFANQGKITEAHIIRRIVDPDGETIEPKERIQTKKLYSPQTAYTLTRILKYAVEAGTGQNARLADGRDVAGKTGTTQNSREAWFVGYTPEYVMAVMVFNDKGNQVELTGGEYPARIFNKVMSDTLKNTPVSRFKAPGGSKPKPRDDGFDWNPFKSGKPEEPRQQPKENPDRKLQPEEPAPEPPEPELPPSGGDDQPGGEGGGATGGTTGGTTGGNTTGGNTTGGNTTGGNTTGDTTGGETTGGSTTGGPSTGGGITGGDGD